MKRINILIIFIIFVVLLAGCKKDKTEDTTIIVEYAVLNPSFEDEIDRTLDYTWDTFQSDTMYSQNNEQSSDGEHSLEVTSLFGGFVSVWQVIPLEGEEYRSSFNTQFTSLKQLSNESLLTLPKIGDKVELSVDILVDVDTNIKNTTPFLVYVESENILGEKTIIAESDVFEIVPGEWSTLTTIPASNNGVIPDDSVLVVISYQINIPEDGVIYLDNTHFGKRVNEDDIDDNIQTVYNNEGTQLPIEYNSFEGMNPFNQQVIYSSDSYYGENSIQMQSQDHYEIELNLDPLISNETLSSGIWMKRMNEIGEASILLSAYYDNEYHQINQAFLNETRVWNFIKTDPSIELKDKTIQKIKIEILNNTEGVLLIDFLQAGDTQAFNGNPERLALIAYQPWYDSETAGWGNWQYTDASDFDGGVNSFPSRFIDGKRDIASVYYPLIGVYNSSDEEVINYHLDLIKAMNIDVIQVNYYANLNQNMKDALEKIFILAEQKDLKVSILYEPKIHILGWIPHSTRMEALEAIEQDIKDFINRYNNSKALLKIDNKPLIEIFGVNILRNTEWNMILDNLATEDYHPYLMGDSIQNSDYSSMKGMFQWDLYNQSLQDATLEEVYQHSLDLNNVTLEWAQKNPGVNIPIGIVYPGFDDTKILGWDLGIARKIDISGPDFYQESWNAIHDLEGLDWILIATFNDWNEGTMIEPEINYGHAMAIITQKEVAIFKNEGIVDASLLEQITQDYLNNRLQNYN